MNTMTQMKWLLKREYWEHRGGMFWAPAIVSMIFAVLTLGGIIIGLAFKKNGLNINGVRVNDLSGQLDKSDLVELANGIASTFIVSAAPLMVLLAIVVFFYSLNALYDDRKDRSILFWKSLPVSDSNTVISKLISILLVTPFITIVCVTVLSLISAVVISIIFSILNVNVFSNVFSTTHLYTLPLEAIACIPFFAIWALPSVGWSMLISTWARRVPIVWAVGVPVMIGVVLSTVEASLGVGIRHDLYWQHIVGRYFAGFLPGTWAAFANENALQGISNINEMQAMNLLQSTWAHITLPTVWIGAVFGVVCIIASIRIRRWRDDS
jgi:ABC-2 type transport system permease protein